MNTIAYAVIAEPSVLELNNTVQALINKGWDIIGAAVPLYVTDDKTGEKAIILYQTVVKYKSK